jgi:hypothetical protein
MDYEKIKELAENPKLKPEAVLPQPIVKPKITGITKIRTAMIIKKIDIEIPTTDKEAYRSQLAKEHGGSVYLDSVDV